ncbi:cutinase family protein [Rhodococcus cerastii]|nr:cutinase family protein [Rhodococcus cerastii]
MTITSLIRILIGITLTTLIGASTFGTALASATPATPVTPSTSNGQFDCRNLTVIAVPGTWESNDSTAPTSPGLLGAVTSQLTGSVQIQQIAYSATAFPWENKVYAQSKKEAVDRTRAAVTSALSRCPGTRIALLGYSQGADAAGDVAAEIGTGKTPIPADRIAAVALIADPQRSATDAIVGKPVPGAGAEGSRISGFGALASRVRTICAPGDLYCSVPSDDFVDRLAGLTVRLSDPTVVDSHTSTAQIGTLLNDLAHPGSLSALLTQLSQQLTPQRFAQIRQFLVSQVHQNYTTYSVDESGTSATTWLARWLNDYS